MTIDGYEDVPVNDEYALKQAATKQPISVGICASPAMQFYRGGVIDTCCEDLNHGVLVVGFGTDEKTGHDYWLVKNSWGGKLGYDMHVVTCHVILRLFIPLMQHSWLCLSLVHIRLPVAERKAVLTAACGQCCLLLPTVLLVRGFSVILNWRLVSSTWHLRSCHCCIVRYSTPPTPATHCLIWLLSAPQVAGAKRATSN